MFWAIVGIVSGLIIVGCNIGDRFYDRHMARIRAERKARDRESAS